MYENYIGTLVKALDGVCEQHNFSWSISYQRYSGYQVMVDNMIIRDDDDEEMVYASLQEAIKGAFTILTHATQSSIVVHFDGTFTLEEEKG